ncbi:hypothetical protein NDU88_008079 [Pleurodeles waltl]|uniref:Uncharacterized protein n=1 Tax=Pleurodeles waltl TaxID=8319 RepID=A0AAV7VW72_PLEWA|nr:hypothetical protein NDU88_008079 [Pleurodeles waltl]
MHIGLLYSAALRCPRGASGSPLGNTEAQFPSPYGRERIAGGGVFKSPDSRTEKSPDSFNATHAKVPDRNEEDRGERRNQEPRRDTAGETSWRRQRA